MFAVLLQAGGGDVTQDALQTVLDGAAQGNIPLAIVGGVVLIGLVILGVLKKEHPLVKPVAEVLLKLGRTFAKPKPPAKPAEQPGLAAVTPIRKLDQSDTEPPAKS